MNTTETRSSKAWPVDGWTVLNSMCGYSCFAFFCLTLPLFLPLAVILPGGRRRWIAAAMRFAMRCVFAVTPTVSWRCDGDMTTLKKARDAGCDLVLPRSKFVEELATATTLATWLDGPAE